MQLTSLKLFFVLKVLYLVIDSSNGFTGVYRLCINICYPKIVMGSSIN